MNKNQYRTMTQTLSLIAPSDGRPRSNMGSDSRKWAAALCAALVTLGLGQVARAAPGDLDPSFDAVKGARLDIIAYVSAGAA